MSGVYAAAVSADLAGRLIRARVGSRCLSRVLGVLLGACRGTADGVAVLAARGGVCGRRALGGWISTAGADAVRAGLRCQIV